jgi:hypothetical protein
MICIDSDKKFYNTLQIFGLIDVITNDPQKDFKTIYFNNFENTQKFDNNELLKSNDTIQNIYQHTLATFMCVKNDNNKTKLYVKSSPLQYYKQNTLSATRDAGNWSIVSEYSDTNIYKKIIPMYYTLSNTLLFKSNNDNDPPNIIGGYSPQKIAKSDDNEYVIYSISFINISGYAVYNYTIVNYIKGYDNMKTNFTYIESIGVIGSTFKTINSIKLQVQNNDIDNFVKIISSKYFVFCLYDNVDYNGEFYLCS